MVGKSASEPQPKRFFRLVGSASDRLHFRCFAHHGHARHLAMKGSECNLCLLKNYFCREIARKVVAKWLILHARNSEESREITALVPFSTDMPVFDSCRWGL